MTSKPLRLRLARLPEERDREVETIENRYRDFVARTFPVAVVFVVPEIHCRQEVSG